MFPKLIGVFFALCLFASAAFPAPQRANLEPFVESIAKKTGLPREQIREHAIEALRESGDFSREELDRIRQHGNEGFELKRAGEAVKLLQNSVKFRVLTGLEALRLSSIAFEASAEFVKLASKQGARDVRQLSIDMQLVDLKMEVNRMLIAKVEHLVVDGRADKATRDAYKSALDGNVALGGDARALANRLYTAVTGLLVARGIPYSTFFESGYAVPSIELGETALRSVVSLLDLPAELAGHAVRARRAIILPTEVAMGSSFDAKSQTLFLGADSLRRIN